MSLCWSDKNLIYAYQYHRRTQPCESAGGVVRKVTAERGVTDQFHALFVKSTHMQQEPVRSMPVSYEIARGHQVREPPSYKAKQACGHGDQ